MFFATATSSLAQALYSIGVLDPANPFSEVRALSQTGAYAVGTSRSAIGTNVPVVWSLVDGLVALPNPSNRDSLAHGVSVGIGANAGYIIISGLHEGNLTHRFYKAPLNNLAGGTWTDTATAGGLGVAGNLRGGLANDLRSHPGHDGRWYTAGRRNDSGRNARFRGDPNSGWDGTAVTAVNSVSAYGVNVGRSGATPSAAFYEGPAQAFSTVPGSTGVRADGHGISPSFGISATSNFDVQWICGQVQNYPGGNFQAFRWKRGEPSMEFLGALPGHTSSTAYSIADTGVTVGRSFISGGETAVVWDTSGIWDTTGTPKVIQDLLNAAGVDTSAWTRLVRAYAVSDDGSVVAGFGLWAADGSTRGFVAVIPEPAT
ncbi:MAG: hypothetical protein N3I86_07290, partial [Verrucomicrobiae bacterium]|nr:hypothetical protein [Verrucomicrobiae bacterium]